MFERGNLEEVDNVVATEYDDCDVTVTTSNGDIDEQIRKIGFQVSFVNKYSRYICRDARSHIT